MGFGIEIDTSHQGTKSDQWNACFFSFFNDNMARLGCFLYFSVFIPTNGSKLIVYCKHKNTGKENFPEYDQDEIFGQKPDNTQFLSGLLFKKMYLPCEQQFFVLKKKNKIWVITYPVNSSE